MNTIGIRREDKTVWERRVPITPDEVKKLTGQGIKVLVEPSKKRVFRNEEYQDAGATVTADLSPADIIFGVKEIPADKFLPGKAYLFFSHTIKGQEYNMAMLRRMMELKCHLFDYEKIVDEEGRRLVLFGRFAGLAGMIDSLHFYGRRLAPQGLVTPLSAIKVSHEYESLEAAKTAVGRAGDAIRLGGLPDTLDPVVCGFAGYGNVSKGAQEIFDLLHPEDVEPEELGSRSPSTSFTKVVFQEKHMARPLEDGTPFELQDYYDYPEKYESKFEQYLPHLTMLINAIYWEERYPRLVTRDYLERAWESGDRKLSLIGDISADIDGAVEVYVRGADPGNPVYVYNPLTGETTDGVEGEGILIEAVDNLPCELPRESSEEFSRALSPFLGGLARADFDDSVEKITLPEPFREALILKDGVLTESYRYIRSHLGENDR